MILDKDNIFSDGQAVPSSVNSTKILDLGEGDLGPAEGVSIFVNVNPPYTGEGTLEVQLKTAEVLSSSGLDLGVDEVTVAVYPLTNKALRDGGQVLAARVPHGLKRYCVLHYKHSGNLLVSGKITSGLVLDV